MQKKCGTIAIIGRPNVGKSTLLNRLLGKKISITSRKPQTTQQNILGIKTQADSQLIFVDTPGLHHDVTKPANKIMNRAARQVVNEVDVVVLIVEALRWQDDDEWIIKLLADNTCPVILAINKVDKLDSIQQLLPYVQMLSAKCDFAAIVPISAKTGKQLEALEQEVTAYLPEQDFIFPAEQITDRDEQFITAEIIREKIMRTTGKELPYAVKISIESFKQEGKLLRISAVIFVNRAGQKAIIIGDKGSRLKDIGTQARLDLERHFNTKVFLQLWVKVKKQ